MVPLGIPQARHGRSQLAHDVVPPQGLGGGWVDALSEADADQVAGALGDLPLAIAQAAGFMADAGIPAREYTGLLAVRATEILDEGRPASYSQSLAAVTQLAFDRLRSEDPAAAELTAVCAFLAPEPIPGNWFTQAAAHLPALLAESAVDAVKWHRELARIGRHALARIDQNGLQMHRLTQAIVRCHLMPAQAASARARAEAIVAANHPGDQNVPSTWPGWARLLPHLLVLAPAETSNQALRDLACDATRYLIRRGDAHNSYDFADRLYLRWRDQFGADDTCTLRVAGALASALRELGRYGEARELDEDTFARNRRFFGDDHTRTLASVTNLAADLYALGDTQAARELDEDTLARKRRLLGDDHPDTLGSANNLAAYLRALGDPQAAWELDEDTLARKRRLLGDDHPSTLRSANNLAMDLRALGDPRAAWELDEDTLARKRRLLGDDHPSTLCSADSLAADIRVLGHLQAARELDRDTFARRCRVLGEHHPDTLISALHLAADHPGTATATPEMNK